MDEELEQLWQKLQLTEEEEEGVAVTKEAFFESSSWTPHCLLVSLWTRKSFNREAFKGTMEKIWKSTPLRRITEVGENLFIFQFKSDEEREIIINTGPWNFDDRMVLVKPLGREDKPGKKLLTKAQLWIQIYGLPFMAMTEQTGRLIGEKMGRVIEVRTDEEGLDLGECLAVRVEIDVRKQLMRRMKIVVEEERVVFVDLKYERLPAICYCCGIIGHNELDCGLAIRKKKEGVGNPAQYGKWIRAPLRQKGPREMGRGGWRNDGTRQMRAIEKAEEAKKGEDGNGGARGTDTAEIGRGKTVTMCLATVEAGNSKINCDFQELANVTGEKAREKLTKVNPLRHSKKEELRLIEEMAWKKAEEEKEADQKLTMGPTNNEMGQKEDPSPMEESKQVCKEVLDQQLLSGEKKSIQDEVINSGSGSQNSWKRKPRNADLMKENNAMQLQNKMGKRTVDDPGLMITTTEEGVKKRKVLNDISNTVSAVAAVQPRRDQ